MKYQLVLQYADTDMSYDELVSLEAALEAQLSQFAEVDGHDYGSGEGNIFILTDDPQGTFKALLTVSWVLPMGEEK